MTALTVSIPEQVKVAINAASAAETLSEAVTADRDFSAFYMVEDIDAALAVSVMPSELEIEKLTRGGDDQHEYGVDVGIYEHIGLAGAERDARVDQLMLFTQQVSDLLRNLAVTINGAQVTPNRISNKPIYDAEALGKFGVFRTLVTVGFNPVRGA